MNRSFRDLLSLAALTAALAAGCGGDDGDAAGDAGSGGSAGSAGAAADPLGRLVQAVCEREASCCGANETLEACRSRFTAAFEPLFTLPGLEANAGRVDACVAAYGAATCAQAASYGGIIPLPVFCADLLAGALPDGSPCGSPDLVASLFDDNQCSSAHCASNACAPAVAEGQPCQPPGGCQAGLTCYQGTCLRPGAEGEDCSQNGLCAPQLDCVTAPGATTATCQTPAVARVGETCGPGRRCELGADLCVCPPGSDGSCDAQVCGRTDYCKP